VFDHPLGDTGSLFCGSKKLATQLKTRFPLSLEGAPALLPSENAPLRRAAETWFRNHDVHPRVVAEFEDPAMMKVMAAEGRGFIIPPISSAGIVLKRYGLHVFGRAEDCRVAFHAFTAERRLEHPAVAAITRNKAWMDEGQRASFP
jgi:LysR family transcriptional activator of nhaA